MTVKMHFVNLYLYKYDKVYAKMDQFEHPHNSLRDVDEAHCIVLVESFCNYSLDYGLDRIMMCFLSTISQEGAANAAAMYTIEL